MRALVIGMSPNRLSSWQNRRTGLVASSRIASIRAGSFSLKATCSESLFLGERCAGVPALRRLQLGPEIVPDDPTGCRIAEVYVLLLGKPPLDLLVAALGPLARINGASAPSSLREEWTADRGPAQAPESHRASRFRLLRRGQASWRSCCDSRPSGEPLRSGSLPHRSSAEEASEGGAEPGRPARSEPGHRASRLARQSRGGCTSWEAGREK